MQQPPAADNSEVFEALHAGLVYAEAQLGELPRKGKLSWSKVNSSSKDGGYYITFSSHGANRERIFISLHVHARQVEIVS